jgi:hypothetical protein
MKTALSASPVFETGKGLDMRFRLALTALSIAAAPAALQAETLTVYAPAPGQQVLDLGKFQSPIAGAKEATFNVGIGSAAFRDPAGPADTYYMASDRGPNFTCDEAEEPLGLTAEAACPEGDGLKAGAGRIYPLPDYTVSIFEVTLDPAAKTFTVTKVLPLKTLSGKPVSGLTNPLKVAKTDVPRDGAGKRLAQDPNAIDAEGLVRLADGRFFIGEENATGIVEISPDGTILRRFVPAGTEADFAEADYPISGSLPAILAKRNNNRGIESLSMSGDGHYLYALVQNPLANPDGKAYQKAINTRLLKVELGKDGDATTLTPVAEYVYQLADWKSFAAAGATDTKQPSSLRISEMTALGHEHFLVDERTDLVAKLFEISLDGATDILGSKWDDAATSPSLEQTDDLASIGIVPVAKTERLVASSVDSAKPRYPGKIEGVTLTADGKLLLVNDDDFGIAGADTAVVIVEGTEIGPR